MNEMFNAFLNGMITVIVHTDMRMHFYWDSADRSSHVIFSYDGVKNETKIPDDGFNYEDAKQKVAKQFQEFLGQLEGVNQ